MGLRAYLMVNIADNMPQGDFIQALRELEDMPGIDFVDPVIGSRDMVIMIEAPVTVESIANKIRQRNWVRNVEVLRVVSLFESGRSSKANLLKALSETVIPQAAAY